MFLSNANRTTVSAGFCGLELLRMLPCGFCGTEVPHGIIGPSAMVHVLPRQMTRRNVSGGAQTARADGRAGVVRRSRRSASRTRFTEIHCGSNAIHRTWSATSRRSWTRLLLRSTRTGEPNCRYLHNICISQGLHISGQAKWRDCDFNKKRATLWVLLFIYYLYV